MTVSRRMALVCLGAFVKAAHAGAYPDRPVHLVASVAAGGPVDRAARLVAVALGQQLKSPVVVENKSGASQTIGTRMVARAEPDGYTLLFGTSFPQHPLFAPNGVAVADVLQPVGNLLRTTLMLVVRTDLGVKSVAELVTYAKAKPHALNNAVTGASVQLVSALFSERVGVQITDVPFQGETQALLALLGGSVDMGLMSPSTAIPNALAGKLRPLMTLGAQRSPLAPQLPTAAESGIRDLSYGVNLGAWAPKGTSPKVIALLSAAMAAAGKDTAVVEKCRAIGFEIVSATPSQQLEIYRQEIGLFGEAARIAGFTPR